MKTLRRIPAALFGIVIIVQLSVHLACAQDGKQPAEAPDSVYVQSINGAEAFDAAVAAAGDTLVMVDLYADWCAPCRQLAPILEEVAKEKRDQVLTFKVNVDQNRDLAAHYQVRSIPYVVFIKNGEMVKSLIGLQQKAAYEEVIDTITADSGK